MAKGRSPGGAGRGSGQDAVVDRPGTLYRARTRPTYVRARARLAGASPGVLPTGLWRRNQKLPPGMGPSAEKSHRLPPGDYSHAYAAIITAP